MEARLESLERLVVSLIAVQLRDKVNLSPELSRIARETSIRRGRDSKAVSRLLYGLHERDSDIAKDLGDLQERLSKLEKNVDRWDLRYRELDSLATKTEQRLKTLSHEYVNLLLTLSDSEALKHDRFRRVLPAHVYVKEDSPNVGQSLMNALKTLCRAMGFDELIEAPPQSGSWFQDIRVRARKALTQPEVQDSLEKARRALELKHIDLVQSEIDRNTSEAAANLMKCLEAVPHAIMSMGSLYGVKITTDGVPKVAILTLNQDQIQFVRQHPELQLDPDAFMAAFSSQKPSGLYDTNVPDPRDPYRPKLPNLKMGDTGFKGSEPQLPALRIAGSETSDSTGGQSRAQNENSNNS
jgi:hypothetical protein